MNRRVAWLIFLGYGFVGAPIFAQDALTADQQQALRQIDQRSVTSAIAFLSSDELEGRGTPSPGLTIAAAYVAARFTGAGLVGGAENESFYQRSSIKSLQTPAHGIEFATTDGKTLSHFGLLSGGPKSVQWQGHCEKIDLSNIDADREFKGVVIAEHDESRSPGRTMITLVRKTKKLAEQGASGLLLTVAPDSGLIEMAKSNRARPRTASDRRKIFIPVLLITGELPEEQQIKINFPAEQAVEQPVANVIGILRGSDENLAEEAVVFSAHLDHLGRRENAGDDPIFNGADDNASGVTGVLSLADAFAALETPPKRTVIFMAYWGEERGLLGSRYFVENPCWPLEKIVANINLEMIGRPEPGANQKAWMTGWDQSDLGSVMAAGARRVGVEIFEHPQFSDRLYRASDNWPLVQAGVVAHSFSAGSLHADYHGPGDEWEKLNLRHMTEVIRGLFAASLPIAEGTVTPRRSPSGRCP